MRAAQDGGARLIVLSGDSHNACAYHLRKCARAAGVELAMPSITSPGFKVWFPGTDPAVAQLTLIATNDKLK